MDGGAWQATIHGVERVGCNLATKPPPSAQSLHKPDFAQNSNVSLSLSTLNPSAHFSSLVNVLCGFIF